MVAYVTHNELSNIDIDGTSLVGDVAASYAKLCRVFGAPRRVGDAKTRVEWCIGFMDGTVVTVYDYKENVPVEKVEHWHIGGRGQSAVIRLLEVLVDD